MRKSVHLKDIAEKAKVSIATVSYVLNGKLTDRINEQTAQKIKKIAKELDYRPNLLAQSLKTQKTQTVGLILPDLVNPFFTRIARVVEASLKSHNYTVFIGSVDEDDEMFKHLITSFMDRKVDGLIVLPLEDSKNEIMKIHESGVPYVLIDRYYPNTPFNYVVNDNYNGIYKLVKCLVERDKRRIGFVTMDYEMHHFEQRKSGFIDACQAFNISNSLIRTVKFDGIKENVHRAMGELINENPDLDAVIFSTDLLALYGLGYVVERQIQVPETLEIAAHDEADYYSIFHHKITYYRQPLEEMGSTAVDFLMKKIDAIETPSIQQVLQGRICES